MTVTVYAYSKNSIHIWKYMLKQVKNVKFVLHEHKMFVAYIYTHTINNVHRSKLSWSAYILKVPQHMCTQYDVQFL